MSVRLVFVVGITKISDSRVSNTSAWHSSGGALAAAMLKVLHGLSRRPHEHVHSSLRCNQGARLDGECARAVVPHGRTRRAHRARSHGKRRPTARMWRFGAI